MNKSIKPIASLILALAMILGNTIHIQAAGSGSLISPAAKNNNPETVSVRFEAFAANGIGMWISTSELMSLPTSGGAWDKLRSTANGSWGAADLKNQDNKHAINTLAGALVYARTGDASLQSKVRDAILSAKKTLDESSEWQTTNGVLAAGRQLGAYVISADLIDLRSFDSATENEFRGWLTTVRTANIGTHGRWKSIAYTCENAAANWSTFACASRIAASIYLGDTADVERSASVIRAFLGERSSYPANAPGQNGYFQHTSDYQASWACDDGGWTGINPNCAKSGVNIDGVLVEDASRGGGCCTLQGSGVSYAWEALQGLYVSVELLYRAGSYDNPYNWSNQALKRATDALQRAGWGITGVATYVSWMANARYGTNYTTAAASSGRIMSWGDWLYPGTTTAPPPQPTASPTSLPPTAVPPTATNVPQQPSPTAIVAQPTATIVPPTAIVVQPTATIISPTAVVVQPTATIVPPTAVVVQPSATALPSTPVLVQPTVTGLSTSVANSSEERVYDDKNPLFVYSTGWQNISHTNAYQGSYKETTRGGATAKFPFTGQSFSILYKGGPFFNAIEVYVDGALVTTLNQKLSTAAFQQRWNYPGQLTSGRHTLKLVFKAASGGMSRGSVDAVIIR